MYWASYVSRSQNQMAGLEAMRNRKALTDAGRESIKGKVVACPQQVWSWAQGYIAGHSANHALVSWIPPINSLADTIIDLLQYDALWSIKCAAVDWTR